MPFVTLVRSLEPGKFATHAASAEAWQGAYAGWLQTLPKASVPFDIAGKRRLPVRLHWRVVQGMAYELWLRANGQSKAPLREFLQAQWPTMGVPAKKDKVALARSLKLWQEHKVASEGLSAVVALHPLGRRKLRSRGVPERLLLRSRGAGPLYKAPELREALFDWFVDIRASLACALTPRFVLYKAKELAANMLASMRQCGVYTPLPKLTPRWLLRWRHSVGISLRKPNSRVKASRQCLEQRLKAMWCNLFRIRRLAQWFLQRDLADSIYGIDEKPLHFNEAGSKNHGTLDIAGVPVCRLKANHAASREKGFSDGSCH